MEGRARSSPVCHLLNPDASFGQALACPKEPEAKIIKTKNHGTTDLEHHLSSHPEYAKKLKDLEEKNSSEKEAMKKTMEIHFKSKGPLSTLDQKVIHIHHIACDNQPFAIVESLTFKDHLPASDRSNLKGYHHYSDVILPKIYDAVKKKIQSCLNECSAISFTSEIWSGPTESFISLTAHGIDKKWNRLKFVLCVRHFPGSHTAETIREAVNSMLEDWGIDCSKCHVFLRDEGSKMRKAFEDALFLHADCGAHKLYLEEKCRSLVGHFNHSNLASDRLKEKQANLGTKIRKLLQDVTMCKRLRKEKTAIELYLTRYDKRNLALSSEDLQVVERIEKLLEPLKSSSDAMCQESAPLSVQFPIALALTSDVHAIRDPELQDVRAKLLGLLVEKFDVEDMKIYGLALFFDPRFKDRCASNKSLFKSNLTSWFREECAQDAGNIADLSNKDLNSPLPKRQNTGNSFFVSHSNLFQDDTEVIEGGSEAALIEMRSYSKLKCIDLEEDPLKFWKEQESTFPILAGLARRFLSAPAKYRISHF